MKYQHHCAEWEPVNINDEFVRFKGEENISIEELQEGFFSCMDKSDAYVISNPNSYEGFMVSVEFGYATNSILNSKGPLKKIYFTNTPLGYDKLDSEPIMPYETFLKKLYNDPSYQNELAYFKKSINSNDRNFRYTSERDFYDDLIDRYSKLLVLKSRGDLIIGLESLLENYRGKKNGQDITTYDDEYEL